MSTGGRPRKVRSQPTSGVGGRPFTTQEQRALLKIGEEHGLDKDAPSVCDRFLTRLWEIYGSYLAAENALAMQVGVAAELFDLKTLLMRANRVRALIRDAEDLKDDEGCLREASCFYESLRRFPNLIAAEIGGTVNWQSFADARRILECSILRIRLWAPHRDEFLRRLDTFIHVCEQAPIPSTFTKRTRKARDMFEHELAELYLEQLHPAREADWRDARDTAPPPARKTKAFPRAVMQALQVEFEKKK